MITFNLIVSNRRFGEQEPLFLQKNTNSLWITLRRQSETKLQLVPKKVFKMANLAYSSLPLTDAATLLFFQPTEIVEFARERGWSVRDEVVHFKGEGKNVVGYDVIRNVLGYAKELESIV